MQNEELEDPPILHSTFFLLHSIWSPWSDSHRRIRVYETRPVASEAQGPALKCRINNEECRMGTRHSHSYFLPFFDLRSSFFIQEWRSHVDLHHEPPPSQSGVQN